MYIFNYLYISNHLCKYSSIKQTSFVCFHSLVYTPNPLVLREELFSVKLLLKLMGLPHGVSPNPFMYIFISLYISTLFVYIFNSLFIFNHLCRYSSITNFVRLFSFTCLYTNSIGIKRRIIPGETPLKTNGPPSWCKSQPSYVHIHFLVHKHPSCTYSFPCTHSNL